MATKQATLTDLVAATTDNVTITRTAVCRLETSQRKNEKLHAATKEFRDVAAYMAAMLPSIPPHQWSRNNNTIYRMAVKEYGDADIGSRAVRNAAHRVVHNYKSARELNRPLPKDGIPDCDFLVLTNQGYTLQENDRGIGLKANFVPYEPEWWHLNIGSHQRELLDRALHGEGKAGSIELAYNDGHPVARIPVSWDVSVTQPGDVERVMGVDIGETTLYAAAVRDKRSGSVECVEMESGSRFRHHREKLSERKRRLQEDGDLRAVRSLKGQRRRYTDHVTHRAAKEIVRVAEEYSPCVVRLEDLTHYRESAVDPIHDWPFAELQEKVANKAREAGVPVEAVDPHGTSLECRKCGVVNKANRDGVAFECVGCGYEVHADVNAALNIAVRGG